MADVIQYDNGTPNKITLYRRSVNTPDWSGQPNTLINPDLSVVQGVEQKYWKHVGGSILEMTQPEKDAVDAAIATADKEDLRARSKAVIGDLDDATLITLQAIVEHFRKELNVVRTDPTTNLGNITKNTTVQSIYSEIDALIDQ